MKSISRFGSFQLTLLLGLICLISISESLGQSIEWEKTYGDSIVGEYSESITLLPDGGYALMGRTFDELGQDEIYLLRLDANGDSLWRKKYFGSTSAELGYDIISTSDGNLAICGRTSEGVGCVDILLMKVDTLGDTIWTKKYGGIYCDQSNALVQTVDSGFALAGYFRENSSQDIKGFVIRTDKNGDSLWSTVLGSGISPPFDKIILEDIILLHGGAFLVSGGRNNDNILANDVYVAKLDSSGNLLWENYYGDALLQKSLAAAQLVDSTIVLSGYHLISGQPHDFLLLNINTNGDSLWSSVMGDTLFNIAYDVIGTDDGGFIFCGDNWEATPPRFFSATVAKFDSSLSQEWSLDIVGSEEYHSYSIKSTLDGGYVIAGYIEAEGGGQPLDLYVAKIQGPPCCQGIRGDVNGDGPDANILDLTHMVDHIFRGSGDPGPCPEESDVNGDGNVGNILDLTYLVDVIFRGGLVPPEC